MIFPSGMNILIGLETMSASRMTNTAARGFITKAKA